jgi:tetrahydromethanopterin S-methyltransferase subunit B
MGDIDGRVFGALERDVKHLTDRIEKLESAVERLEASIDRLTALLDQARGARWILGLVIGLPVVSLAAVNVWKALKGQ